MFMLLNPQSFIRVQCFLSRARWSQFIPSHPVSLTIHFKITLPLIYRSFLLINWVSHRRSFCTYLRVVWLCIFLMKQCEMPAWCNGVILLMYSQLYMFRAHTPIIRSTGCWVAAYDFLHRVCGWVVVLGVANLVQKTICCNSTSNASDDGTMHPKHVELRIHQ